MSEEWRPTVFCRNSRSKAEMHMPTVRSQSENPTNGAESMARNQLSNKDDDQRVRVTFVESVRFLSARPALLGRTPTVTVSVERSRKGRLIVDNLSLTHGDALNLTMCMAETLAAAGDELAIRMMGSLQSCGAQTAQGVRGHRLDPPNTGGNPQDADLEKNAGEHQ